MRIFAGVPRGCTVVDDASFLILSVTTLETLEIRPALLGLYGEWR